MRLLYSKHKKWGLPVWTAVGTTIWVSFWYGNLLKILKIIRKICYSNLLVFRNNITVSNFLFTFFYKLLGSSSLTLVNEEDNALFCAAPTAPTKQRETCKTLVFRRALLSNGHYINKSCHAPSNSHIEDLKSS